MKHIRFCPVRKKDSGVLLLFACLMFLLCILVLIVSCVKHITQTPALFSSLLFFIILSIFLLGVVKRQYCNREVAFWAVLTKKAISVVGPLYYTKIKLANVEKVLVCHMWIYNNKDFERIAPKGARPRWAEFTGNNRKHFDFQSFFILIPKTCSFDLNVKVDSSGKTKLTSENYKKYKNIANNKKIIIIDGTEKNYKFLRQVFEYEKFAGVKKYDVKHLEEFEQLFEDI